MALSNMTIVSDGDLEFVSISFNYLDRSEINVYFDSVPTSTWAWVGDTNQIKFTPKVPNGVTVLIARMTDASDLRHVFSEGAAFTARTLDEDLRQVLHIVQEAKETNLSGNFYDDIDMNNNKITNLAPGSNPSDAVTFQQLQDLSPDAGLRAELAKDYSDTGSGLVGFRQDAVGAVGSSVESKLRETVSVKDFGAVGDGVTDDTAAFNAAIAVSNLVSSGISIFVPRGVYRVTSDLVTITSPTHWIGEGRSRSRINFESCDGLSYDLSGSSVFFISSGISELSLLTNGTTHTGIYFKGRQTFSPHDAALVLNGVSLSSMRDYDGTTPTSAEWGIGIYIDDADEIVFEDVFIKGSSTNVTFGGLTTSVGVKVVTCTGLKMLSTNLYLLGTGVDISGQSEGLICQGCTFVAMGKGFYCHDFVNPANNYCISDSHFSTLLTGIDFQQNTPHSSNAEGVYISGCFILEAGPNAAKPSYTAINLNCRNSAITNCTLKSNTTATPNRTGIVLSASTNLVNNVIFFNQKNLIDVVYNGDSKLSRVNNCTADGDISAYVIGDTTRLIRSGFGSPNAWNISADELSLIDLTGENKLNISGARVLFGTRASDLLYLDFRSKIAGTAAYDGRILSNGGDLTNTGMAALTYYGASHSFSGVVRPVSDNSVSCGDASNRWSQIFAGSGTINTSDERAKQDIRYLSQQEQDAARKIKGLLRAFRFKDAVAEKGDGARIHFGVIAQQVAEAFTDSGLDPHQYALFCHDTWDATDAVVDEATGEIIIPAKEAGDRYGIRYEELLAFIITAC